MTDFINTFDPARLLDLLRYDAASPLLFNTGLFLLLFAGFMAVYHILRHRPTLRMVATILFSLYFYYKSSAECCLLLLGICLNDYLAGLALGALRRPVWRRRHIAGRPHRIARPALRPHLHRPRCTHRRGGGRRPDGPRGLQGRSGRGD